MTKKKIYKVRGKVVCWSGNMSTWYFLGVPKKESKEIRVNFGRQRRGFGSLPVEVTIGETTWTTSIFPDTKADAYILPIKKSVRRSEGVFEGDDVDFVFKLIL